MVYYLFAKRLHFTPEQVDNMDSLLVEAFMIIMKEDNEPDIEM